MVPTAGTLAEADALSFHFYQYSFCLSGLLQGNAHGLDDAMRALALRLRRSADIRTVRIRLYEIASRD